MEQLKFQYLVDIELANGTAIAFRSPDMVRMPEVRRTTVKRQNNKLGQEIHGTGRATYGELVIRGAMVLLDSGTSTIAQAVAALEQMEDSLYDRANISIQQLDQDGALTYVTSCEGCSLVALKVDDLDRQKGDDDVCHVELTFQPSVVRRWSGPQAG